MLKRRSSIRIILSLFLVLVVSLGCGSNVLAAQNYKLVENNDINKIQLESTNNTPTTRELPWHGMIGTYVIGNAYVNVLVISGGINDNITLIIDCPQLITVDVKMLDLNGNVAWEEKAAMGHFTRERTFWCGPNIKAVQARVGGSDMHQVKANCQVWTD